MSSCFFKDQSDLAQFSQLFLLRFATYRLLSTANCFTLGSAGKLRSYFLYKTLKLYTVHANTAMAYVLQVLMTATVGCFIRTNEMEYKMSVKEQGD